MTTVKMPWAGNTGGIPLYLDYYQGSMIDALERAVKNGVKNLIVQPTHLMHGAEYDELTMALGAYSDKMRIVIAEPLLGEVGEDATVINEDKKAVAEYVRASVALENDAAGSADAYAAVASHNGDLRIADLSGGEIMQILLLQLDAGAHVAYYEAQGMDRKEAMRCAARDRGVSRREIYQQLL